MWSPIAMVATMVTKQCQSQQEMNAHKHTLDNVHWASTNRSPKEFSHFHFQLRNQLISLLPKHWARLQEQSPGTIARCLPNLGRSGPSNILVWPSFWSTQLIIENLILDMHERLISSFHEMENNIRFKYKRCMIRMDQVKYQQPVKVKTWWHSHQKQTGPTCRLLRASGTMAVTGIASLQVPSSVVTFRTSPGFVGRCG